MDTFPFSSTEKFSLPVPDKLYVIVFDSGSIADEDAIIVPIAESSLNEGKEREEDNDGASLISLTLINTSVSELRIPSEAVIVKV